jgi:hypothetical protein
MRRAMGEAGRKDDTLGVVGQRLWFGCRGRTIMGICGQRLSMIKCSRGDGAVINLVIVYEYLAQ